MAAGHEPAPAAGEWELPSAEAEVLRKQLFQDMQAYNDSEATAASKKAIPLTRHSAQPTAKSLKVASSTVFRELEAQWRTRPGSPFSFTVLQAPYGREMLATLPAAAKHIASMSSMTYPKAVHVHVQRSDIHSPPRLLTPAAFWQLGRIFEAVPQLRSLAVTVHEGERNTSCDDSNFSADVRRKLDQRAETELMAELDPAFTYLLQGVASAGKIAGPDRLLTITLPVTCPPKLAAAAAAWPADIAVRDMDLQEAASGPSKDAADRIKQWSLVDRPPCDITIRRKTDSDIHVYTAPELAQIAEEEP